MEQVERARQITDSYDSAEALKTMNNVQQKLINKISSKKLEDAADNLKTISEDIVGINHTLNFWTSDDNGAEEDLEIFLGLTEDPDDDDLQEDASDDEYAEPTHSKSTQGKQKTATTEATTKTKKKEEENTSSQKKPMSLTDLQTKINQEKKKERMYV